MKSAVCYINGEFVLSHAAKISVFDAGFLRGLGVFAFLRTYGGRPFHLKEHLLRLEFSAKWFGIALPHALEEISQLTNRLLEKNGFEESLIRILITGGENLEGFGPGPKASLCILIQECKPYPASFYLNGTALKTAFHERFAPYCKSTNYLAGISLLKLAEKNGYDDVLYINSEGHALETTRGNLFCVKDNVLITPDRHVLFGITREVILTLAEKDGFFIERRPLALEELLDADEVFVSASIKEILPVNKIDSRKYPFGKSTRTLMALFQNYVQKGLWPDLNMSFEFKENIPPEEAPQPLHRVEIL